MIGPTTIATSAGVIRIYLASTATMITGELDYEVRRTAYHDNYPYDPPDITEYIAQTKEERKRLYRTERLRESSTAMHFAWHRSPRLEARQHGDPLRHHRLRGFRRASRRDQTDIRIEGAKR